MRITLLIYLFTIHTGLLVLGNGNETQYTRKDYIDRWKVTALKNMFEHHIPASITLAQGILESGNGNSTLTRKANNHFGIKCHGWDGPGYYMDDDKKDECFRKYKKAEDSFEDHSLFLLKPRYADLFSLKLTDYKGWAKGLKKAGYATNPEYANRLIKIIEENKLYEFDKYSYEDYLVLKNKSKYDEDSNALVVEEIPLKKKSKKTTKEGDEVEITLGRKQYVHENKINYIIAKDGDTPATIANDMNLGKWQILKYNELDKNDQIHSGDVIFIQPKHNKSKKKSCVVKNGDSWRSISQEYGIKMNKLLKMNNANSAQILSVGQKIVLR